MHHSPEQGRHTVPGDRVSFEKRAAEIEVPIAGGSLAADIEHPAAPREFIGTNSRKLSEIICGSTRNGNVERVKLRIQLWKQTRIGPGTLLSQVKIGPKISPDRSLLTTPLITNAGI